MPKKPRKTARRKSVKKKDGSVPASAPAPQAPSEKSDAPRGYELSPYQ